MIITCVIATRDPHQCHTLIAQLHAYGHQIVVVHPDTTPAPTNVISIRTSTLMSPAQARNLGADASNSELICFLDDDIIIDNDVPRILAHVFCAPHVVACGAVLHDHPTNDYWQRAFHRMTMVYQHRTSAVRIPLLLASMALMVRRTAFMAAGRFDNAFLTPAGEDADLSLRLRHYGTIMTLPQARISHHPHPHGWQGVTHRSWRYGTAWPQVRRRHPQIGMSMPIPPRIIALVIYVCAPLLALIDIARTRRSRYWFGRWWLRTWWYLGVARGMQS